MTVAKWGKPPGLPGVLAGPVGLASGISLDGRPGGLPHYLPSHPRHGAPFIHVADSDRRGRIVLPQPGHHLCGPQRIPAQIGKKIRIDGHGLLKPENVAEDLRQAGLQRVPWRGSRFAPRRPVEPRERGPVELPSHRERQIPQNSEPVGDHVIRQGLPQGGFERAKLLRLPAVFRHDEGGQSAILHGAGGRAHTLPGRHARFNLFQLHAVPADLHLRIGPPMIEVVAIGGAMNQVSGAVNPPETRVGNKLLGGLRGPVSIPARQPDPAQAQLAPLAFGGFLKRVVEHPRLESRDRPPDGNGFAGMNIGPRGRHRALGGAVAVHQPSSLGPAISQILRQGLAAGVDELKLGQLRFGVLATHGAQQRGRRTKDGNPFAAEPRCQIRPQPHGFVIHHYQGGPGRERQPDFFDGGVVGRRGVLRDARIGRETEFLDIGSHQVHDAPMLHHHAFGPPGGARCVDHISQAGGVGQALRRRGGRILHLVHHQDAPAESNPSGARRALGIGEKGGAGILACLRHPRRQARRPAPRVFQDFAYPPVRKGRVHRGVGAACLERPQLGAVEPFGAPRQEDGDNRIAPRQAPQRARHCFRLPLQLRVRHPATVGPVMARRDLHGRPLRPAPNRTNEELVQQDGRGLGQRLTSGGNRPLDHDSPPQAT